MTPEEQKAIRDAATAKMQAMRTAPCPAGQSRQYEGGFCQTPEQIAAEAAQNAASTRELHRNVAIQLAIAGVVGYGGYRWSKTAGAIAAVSGVFAVGTTWCAATSKDMGGLGCAVLAAPAILVTLISGGIAMRNRSKRSTPNRRGRRR